jgi:hypothetical protein
MGTAIICQEGKRVGIAESEPQGVGVVQWFHNNAGGQSADYYLQHAGYSVEEVEPDCGEVEALINAIAERAGLTMESTFVPYSQSENSKGNGPDGKPWESLNWRVTLKRDGRDILTTSYSQGTGYCPADKRKWDTKPDKAKAIALEIETGKMATRSVALSGRPVATQRPIPGPSIGEVMQSLVRDADALHSAGFDDWAADYGYDTDSRKAESIYRACLEIGQKLRAGLGQALLDELRLAAQFN